MVVWPLGFCVCVCGVVFFGVFDDNLFILMFIREHTSNRYHSWSPTFFIPKRFLFHVILTGTFCLTRKAIHECEIENAVCTGRERLNYVRLQMDAVQANV